MTSLRPPSIAANTLSATAAPLQGVESSISGNDSAANTTAAFGVAAAKVSAATGAQPSSA
jgi:hypothetical protein